MPRASWHRRLSSLQRTPEIQIWLGEAYARLGLSRDSERAFQRAIELDDVRPEAWLLLGKLLLRDGRLDEAREALLRAQALDRENPAPCLAIAELKAQMGLYEEVDRWTQAVWNVRPRMWILPKRSPASI